MTAAASSIHGEMPFVNFVPPGTTTASTTTTSAVTATDPSSIAAAANGNDDDSIMVLDDKETNKEESLQQVQTTTTTTTTTQSQSQSLDFTLAKCQMPPSHEFDPVQTFVARTILEQHQLVNQQQQEQQEQQQQQQNSGSGNNNSNRTTAAVVVTTTATTTMTTTTTEAYRGLLDLLRHANHDVNMLTYILLALRTSDHGNTLNRITSAANQHIRLVHQLVRFNPFPSLPPIAAAVSTTTTTASTTTTPSESSSPTAPPPPPLDYALADAHLSLLIAIVSKKTVFLVPAMGSLWRMLSTLSQSQQPSATGAMEMQQQQQQPVEQTRRLHAALATLIRLVPKAKTELFGIIMSNCPYPTRHVHQITWYYQQALFALHYLPSMRDALLQFMIQKCLELDVEIKITEGGEATLDTDHDVDNDNIFDLEMNNGIVAKTKRHQNHNAENEQQRTVDEMADKLDCLMLLLLEYVEQQATHSTVLLHEIYSVFWDIFERGILCTYKSKFVQFLLLHICSLEYQINHKKKKKEDSKNKKTNDNDHDIDIDNGNLEEQEDDEEHDDDETMYRDFAIKLVNIIIDPYRSSVTRQAGACYLASFVSRCKSVGAETVCEAVCALLRWAETYIQQTSTTNANSLYANDYDSNHHNNTSLGVVTTNTMTTAPDARHQCHLHALFYTICQAAFYIICFRGKEAIQFSRKYTNPNVPYDVQPRELIDIRMSRWTRLVAHATLQPLRHCLESVRLEFLHVARLFHLVEPDVLERLETMAQVLMSNNDSDCSSSNKPRTMTRASVGKGRLSMQRQRKKPGAKIATAAMVEKERVSGGVGGLGQGTNPLDSFFPFDPYLLRRSHAYIEPHYNHWTGSLSPEDYDGSHDYDDYDDDDDEDGGSVPDDLDVDAATIEEDEEEDDDDDDDDDGNEDDDDTNMMSQEDEEDEENDTSDLDDDVADDLAATSLSSSLQLPPMVLTPATTSTPPSALPNYMVKREELRKAWSQQHNRSSRPRSASIENGSW